MPFPWTKQLPFVLPQSPKLTEAVTLSEMLKDGASVIVTSVA